MATKHGLQTQTAEPQTGNDKAADVKPKPIHIHIKLCDNGWLVGVHFHPQGGFDHCGAAPSATYVFNTVQELGDGIKKISMGEEVRAALT